jgi:2-dehydro-3-deoxyphosphogluconate aldolase/(4S)-4-hydroxy-2-oxoglutarate aldolase
VTSPVSRIEQIMRMAPVIPVLVIGDAAQAVAIATALVAGGLPVLEVTLRTASALEVIRAMKQVPGAIVGAGTVLNEHALDDALEAGSEFIVSPGLTGSQCAVLARDRDRVRYHARAGSGA